MAPPFDNHAGLIVVKEYILGPLSGAGGIWVWHRVVLTTIGKFRDIALAIEGAS